MPTRYIARPDRPNADDKVRHKALHDAAHVGIEDIEAGRVHDFSSARELRSYLNSLTRRTLERNGAR